MGSCTAGVVGGGFGCPRSSAVRGSGGGGGKGAVPRIVGVTPALAMLCGKIRYDEQHYLSNRYLRHRALHSTPKTSRVPMGCGNVRPVFKEYCRPYRVKNSAKAKIPNLGAFKATTSSTVPGGMINHSQYSCMAPSFAARTTLWPPSTVACSYRALQCGEETDRWGSRWPTRASNRLAAPVKRTNVAVMCAITCGP